MFSSIFYLFYFRMLELRVQYLDDNATDGSGELSTPAGELIGTGLLLSLKIIFYIIFGPLGSESISQKYGSGSLYQQTKLVRITLIPTVL